MADKKLAALRAWMATRGLDAYLVPHSDRFQSEYLQPQDERLAWLSGFTGSAGLAAILKGKAALFTDGRYSLQAHQQVDGAFYDCVTSPPEPPSRWLGAHLPEPSVIGFDPWLMTMAQLKQWENAAKTAGKNGWRFVPVAENGVDHLWRDKPCPVIQKALPHPLRYAGRTIADKLADLRERMHPQAGAVLHCEPALVCWLLNMRGRDIAHTPLVLSMAVVPRTGPVTLFADPLKIGADLRETWGDHVIVAPLDALFGVLEQTQGALQLDPLACPVAVQDFCLTADVPILELQDPALLLRACKNATEIEGAINAHREDARALQQFRDWFAALDFERDFVTELDVMQKLSECRRASPLCQDESFETIAGFAANGAIVHYRADEKTARRLTPDQLLLLDSGGQYREGTTDITRVFVTGTPTAQMKKHYTAVLKGLIALSLARFPQGTSGAALDALARAPVWALGLDYAHGTGHGIGSYLSVHEGPWGFSPHRTLPLQAGMILSVEPGIYLEGVYGIRLENLVVVEHDPREGDHCPMLALRTLTCVPFEEKLIDRAMLDTRETEFLARFTGQCHVASGVL